MHRVKQRELDLSAMSASGHRTELCFLDVPAPQSRYVVEQLAGKTGFAMAAAVYSGDDVIVVVEGTDAEIDRAYQTLAPDSTPNVDSFDRFPADSVVEGPSFASREMLLNGACLAFVRCRIRAEEMPVLQATSILATLPGVTRLFPNDDRQEVILEVLAPDKPTFDRLIMSSIQSKWDVVKATRTFLLINSMIWRREQVDDSSVFISTAKGDLHRALWLGNRIKADIGLPCWTYNEIPVGTESWADYIDDVIDVAPLGIFLISEAFLASDECLREFARVEAVADPNDICCVLLPGCEISDLPMRYQKRQCLVTADFRSYPLLVSWMRERLKAPLT
jgi:hypothetical protein